MNDNGEEKHRRNQLITIIIVMILSSLTIGYLIFISESPEGENIGEEYQPIWTEVDEDQVLYFLEPLYNNDGPVLILYGIPTSSVVDEMAYHIDSIEEDYQGQITVLRFLDLDYDSEPWVMQSYYHFDVLGTPEAITGVPMFTIITCQNVNNTMQYYFATIYGSSADGGLEKKQEIIESVEEAIGIYDGSLPPPNIIHLYVSNQSFADVSTNITIKVNGISRFNQQCWVEDQHNWILVEFNLPNGEYVFDAYEKDNNIEGTETIDIQNEKWIVIEYWYDPSSPTNGERHFTTYSSDTPVCFA